MSLEAKQQEIIEEFAIFDEWMEKYEYIIDLGKELAPFSPEKKTNERIIEGCQSQVWLDASYENGKMHFTADSDAIITKGIIGLLIRVLDNESPEEIVKADLHFINAIDLHEHLSPTRSNGLVSMVKKMKMAALKALSQQDKI